MAPPFKCDDCEFEGLSYKILNIHKGKPHKIGAQADYINYEDIIELDQGRLCQTQNFLFVSNKSFWNYLYM